MGCAFKQGGGLYERLRIGAVLLAAGEGKRMGGAAKALITLQGVPLIRRHLIALSGAGVDEVVVVTGHAAERVEAAISDFPLTVVRNERWQDGQQGSVRLGLEAMSGHFDAIVIVLCDQPLIQSGDIVELLAAFKKRGSGHVLIPTVAGQRGNPIVLDAEAITSIRSSEVNLACRKFVQDNPALVTLHETANTRFLTDLDTREDVERLAAKSGWKLGLELALADTVTAA
jgi:CTP:molybdopterin cytidylyltransferase MocA